MARTALKTLVEQQVTMSQVLTSEVYTGDLTFLREVLELLEHMDDLQHSIDDQYLPVEEMYLQLKYVNGVEEELVERERERKGERERERGGKKGLGKKPATVIQNLHVHNCHQFLALFSVYTCTVYL